MSIFGDFSKSPLIAIFDITNSSVGGLLLECHQDKAPEIISVFRQPVDFLLESDAEKARKPLHKTFESVISHLKKKMPKGRKKPDLAFIIFSSPYYVCQTRIIRHAKDKPFEINKKFLGQLITDEINIFKKEQKGEYILKNEEAELLEKEIMSCKLNGYPINNPIAKKAKTVELSIYMSLGIEVIKDKLEECITHSFGETLVKFQTFPLVAFKALKSVLDLSRSLLLVDIGGENTDLMLIRDNILESAVSFPLGENFLVRRIASVFRFSLAESVSILNQYIRGDLHTETHEKVKKILEDAGGKWCRAFNKILSEFPYFSSRAQNRLIIGGVASVALKEFIICVKDQPLQIDFLLPEAFRNHFIFQRGFNEDKDISLMLSGLFVNGLF